jgi:valyl-tRNA synthetase
LNFLSAKGNGVDPVEVLEEYGADALRFWAAGSKLGGDLDYQEQDLIAGRKTVKKLWNASKFVFMNLEDYNGEKPKKLEKLDKEFLKELDHLVSKVTFNFNKYQYSFSKADTEKIFWKDFADNYIEAVKGRIYNQTGDKKISAQYTLPLPLAPSI